MDKRFHNMLSGGAFQCLPAVPSRLTPDRGFRSAVRNGKVTNNFWIWQMIFLIFLHGGCAGLVGLCSHADAPGMKCGQPDTRNLRRRIQFLPHSRERAEKRRKTFGFCAALQVHLRADGEGRGFCALISLLDSYLNRIAQAVRPYHAD